MYSKFLKFKYS